MQLRRPQGQQLLRYFSLKFDDLKLKKLITTCYKNTDATLFSQHADKHVFLTYEGARRGPRTDGGQIGIHPLEGTATSAAPSASRS